MSLKDKLLNPEKRPPYIIEFNGDKFPVRRYSSVEVTEKQREMTEVDTKDSFAVDRKGAEFILASMLDDDGQPMAETTTPEELLEIYSPAEISKLGVEIMKVNYSGSTGVEDAKKG